MSLNILILLVAVLAGTATYAISYILNKGTVFASATVTLISGIFLPYIFPEIGSTLMTVAACTSYAGMVSIKNVPNIKEMIIVSLITGTLFMVFSSAYIGIGGRLGSIAAISCISWVGFKKIITNDKLTTKRFLSNKNNVNLADK